MKKVRFGRNQIIYVENISKYLSWPSSFIEKTINHCKILSVIREYYTEDPRLDLVYNCLLYTSPSPRDGLLSRMPSSA